MKSHYRIPLLMSCVLLACSLTAGVASADIYTYSANLTGAAAIPPSGSTATGTATLTINTDLTGPEGYLTLHVEFSGLSSAQASAGIYAGSAASNGSLIMALPLGSPVDSILILTLFQSAMFSNALYSDSLYLNIDSVDFPGGEIRGNFTLINTVGEDSASWGGIKALYR